MVKGMKREAWSGKRESRAFLGYAIVPLLLLGIHALADDSENTSAQPTVEQAAPPPSPVAAEKAPNFTLPNAQAGMTRVKWPREKAVFLTFGEQASQTAIQAWSGKMKEHYGERMEFVGVAWLERVPQELHVAAEAFIKANNPDVLMDKSGTCAQRYQCKPGIVNAFVIAPDGTILKRIHEPMTDEGFAAVEKLLEPFTTKSE